MIGLMDISKIESRAELEQQVIRPLAMKFRNSAREIERACSVLSLKRSQVYAKIKAYRESPYLDTLTPALNKMPGHVNGRLNARVEEIIKECIQVVYLEYKEGSKPADVHAKVFEACVREGLPVPSLSTVRRRMLGLPKLKLAKAGKLKGSRKAFDLHPHHHFRALPLDEVQMDHTLVDAMLDLREYGLGVRRPWLTVAIDIATRMVYGYYIGLRPPKARTFMFALLQGAMPKLPWLTMRGLDAEALLKAAGTSLWPMQGLMGLVAMDNGADFKSKLVRRACLLLGIVPSFRIPGEPHYGGHIERLIGTLMGRVKILPGTTYSNVVEKAEYESEKNALMTLDQFEIWFLLEILRYHHTKHSELGITPLQKYEALIPHLPKTAITPPDPYRVQYAFLPSVTRKVQKYGVTLCHRTYWHGDLAAMLGLDVRIMYRPWDMRTVSLSLDGRSEHMLLNLMADGSDIVHGDIWDMTRNDPAIQAETKRQELFAMQTRNQQFDFVDDLRRQNRASKRAQILSADATHFEPSSLKLLGVDDIPICSAGARKI